MFKPRARRNPFARRALLPFTLCGALLASSPGFGQKAQELAPADVPVYIHIENPAGWFADLTQGPIGQKLRDQVETSEGSGDLLAALGMNLDEFMNGYFGGEVVVLSEGEGDDAEERYEPPGVIFTQVPDDLRDRAIESLMLQRNGELQGYPVYIGADGSGYFIMLDDWVGICDLDDVEFLTDALATMRGGKRLGDTERYARWTRELPAKRAMTMIAYDGEDSQHALGVVREGRGMDATYLGFAPEFEEMFAMLGEAGIAEFGPLPTQSIMAMSFNMLADDKRRQDFAGLDPLLGGKSFVDDVLPKLDTPSLIFMGSVDGEDVEPTLQIQAPVMGMAFKLKDQSVVADLNRMLDGVMLMANFGISEFQAGAIPQRNETYKGASFKVAELGRPIAQGLEFKELSALQVAYGQVGDYYVLCTHEAFFKQCIATKGAEKGIRIDVEGPAHRLAKTPVLAMVARPDGFGEMLLSWRKMVQERGLPDVIDPEADQPVDTETLMDVVGLLQQYSRMKMQVWRGEDDLVIGRAQLTAPQ